MFSLNGSLDVAQGQSDVFWRKEESCLWLQAGCLWFRVGLVNQTMDNFRDQLDKIHQILSEIFRETKFKLLSSCFAPECYFFNTYFCCCVKGNHLTWSEKIIASRKREILKRPIRKFLYQKPQFTNTPSQNSFFSSTVADIYIFFFQFFQSEHRHSFYTYRAIQP